MRADYIFETSWEVCNKVGGIYTVLSTKAATVAKEYHDNYICIGPDISKEHNGDFKEDALLFANWRRIVQKEGLKVRIGRWNINGSPVVFLVDFTPFFERKNEIFTHFWLHYRLDSIFGQWDYIEPALFGYAAGKLIESFYKFYCNSMDKIVAQFHEWMTGTGILYIEDKVPQIATVFTTHATVLGRSIAGNGLPLYDDIGKYNNTEMAARFGVQSKFSLETLSALHADAFTTVSCITDKECNAFLGKSADVITINGFDDNFVPHGEEYDKKRLRAREALLHVASSLTQQSLPDDALLVMNSGRYEFRNKGIDVFIASVARVAKLHPDRTVVAYLMIPSANSGIRVDLLEKMNRPVGTSPVMNDFVTHVLHDPHNDQILKAITANGLTNAPDSRVKIIYVPVYLDGKDGIFNLPYYDLLIGFDLSVYPSYYEPWGYTPLESIAFGIPTVTTSLAGFGFWIREHFGEQQGVIVIKRVDGNDDEVSDSIANAIVFYSQIQADRKRELNEMAMQMAQKALWTNLFDNYLNAYGIALGKSASRYEMYRNKMSDIGKMADGIKSETPAWRHVSVKSHLPACLSKLEKLADNLWWSWHYPARELFEEIAGPVLWKDCGQNPVYLLQVLPLERINKFAENREYITRLTAVYDEFTHYMQVRPPTAGKQVAYFSMEFGISNELKIFSGGLGVLAGDYLKEASDCNVDLVGVSLLYRYGYFTQEISNGGDQINLYQPQSFSKLPIRPLKDAEGEWIKVSLSLPGRQMYARIWRVDVGRIPLYLLDTDFSENWDEDRGVTGTLYGGNDENRLKQEMLLGIGGIRMLEIIGAKPAIFHLNEGHAAFLNLERIHQTMRDEHVNMSIAVELTKATSLYTTHTPVPAGHDAFSEDLMRTYFAFYPNRYNISWETFMGFGRKRDDCVHDKFSMSVLACRFSQEINGVSRIHGRVTREMFADLYNGRFAEELHIGHVTNGVHYPTWAHKKWQQLHAATLGSKWKEDISDPAGWSRIYQVEDRKIWQLKDDLRREMIDYVKKLLDEQMRRRNESPAMIDKTLKSIRYDALTIGFARRFATYKRAYLPFVNEERLERILNNPDRPVQLLFAGKAHPHDTAGQDMITRIIEFSRKPQFVGKIIFIENYDMILAKKLVSGCDVWLNMPTRLLEASGTSGEKAAMNGVLNFSVMDGWWAEGYVAGAGWAIREQTTYQDTHLQDELDAAILYSTVEEQIIPAFYNRDRDNVPPEWVGMMKNCFAKIAPHYTMKRQLNDYFERFYPKLTERHQLLMQDNMRNVHDLLKWEDKMLASWNDIALVDLTMPHATDTAFYMGESLSVLLSVNLAGILPEDVKIELVLTEKDKTSGHDKLFEKFPFTPLSMNDGIWTFECRATAEHVGNWNCAIRIIPQNPLLPHDMDFNIVKWM